jgi:4'-phosphopantetheinyl transferase
MTEIDGGFRETGAVHIWHGRVRDQLPPSDLAVLADDELARARWAGGAPSAHYAGVRAAVRRVLGDHYLGLPPSAVRFGRHACPRCTDPAHGRPRVEHPATPLDFNLSRSGPYWLLAVTAGAKVGVDIERLDSAVGVADVALTEDERARMRGLEAPERRQELFYRAWTRKEAVLKACGVGIFAELESLEASPADPGPVTMEYSESGIAGRWHVQDLALTPGLVGALAQDAGSVRPVVTGRTALPASRWQQFWVPANVSLHVLGAAMKTPLPSGDELVLTLATLANPHRLRVVAVLAGGRKYVSQLARDMGISRALLQVHLKKLEAAGLVSAQMEISPDGKAMKFYEVTPFAVHLTPESIAAVVPEMTGAGTARARDEKGTV